ncbi:MAG: hydroxyethylthiazole kinase [Candidatus Coatesbacteria bacterium]|nr:MAG: hydroxyethylthiazole kinase [Candidatus Coatesbacteria bacterium]
MKSSDETAARDLNALREKKPLVHNITNFVVMNSTANVLLAAGASPVMAHAENEVEDMVSLAGALVLNIGTLTDEWVRAMVVAGRKANELGVPVVLDPVGAGATGLRTAASQELLGAVDVAVVRANASEVLALAGGAEATKGVDSVHSAEEAAEVMPGLAKELGCTIAVTGETDVVTDGEKTLEVAGGHPLMGYVTGTGCAATVLVGAFLAVDDDSVQAAAGGLAFFGLAGTRASEKCPGPGTFWIRVLDELYNITDEDLRSAGFISER